MPGRSAFQEEMHMIVFQFESTFGQRLVGEDRTIQGQSSGHTLLRRLLGLVEDPAILIPNDQEELQCEGFRTVTFRSLGHDDVVVNFNPNGNMELYHRHGGARWMKPSLANFVWFNVGETTDQLHRATSALAYRAFPTFCNSQRTASEVRGDLVSWLSASHVTRARIEWANLGIDPIGWEDRTEREVPVVWYPSTWLFNRKRPQMWIQIIDQVATLTKIEAVMRLSKRENNSARLRWSADRPYLTVRDAFDLTTMYRRSLKNMDVFLATAEDESYGLAYLEALSAGMVGVFPERPWVRTILPDWYPFVYSDARQAVGIMASVCRDLEWARQQIWPMLDDYIAQAHSEMAFDMKFREWTESIV